MTASVRPAATVLLIRPGPRGFRVLLVQRHRRSPFLPEAWVFPGGRVDPADARVGAERLHGLSEAVQRTGEPAGVVVPFFVAAIRETFEEAGVWLGPRPLPEDVRGPLARREIGIAHALATHDAILDLAAMHPWARWVTPEAEPRRYDTRFFLTVVGEVEAHHDEHETVASQWIRPAEALAAIAAGTLSVAPPTWWTLVELDRYGTLDGVIAGLSRRPRRPIQPILEGQLGGDVTVKLPGHPDHPEPAIAGVPRFVAYVDGRWWTEEGEPIG